MLVGRLNGQFWPAGMALTGSRHLPCCAVLCGQNQARSRRLVTAAEAAGDLPWPVTGFGYVLAGPDTAEPEADTFPP